MKKDGTRRMLNSVNSSLRRSLQPPMRNAALQALVFLALALLPCGQAAADAQPYSNAGAKPCLECHESKAIMGIVKTPHANFDDPDSPASQKQCESCHGASATHMDFPMQVGNTRFGSKSKTSVEAKNQTCLTCHQEGAREGWKLGPHGLEDLACASCHSIHQSKDPILSRPAQAARCTDSCHGAIASSPPADAPHKVGMDDLTCTSCHNPHGPIDLSTCLTCHPLDAADLATQSPKTRGYHERSIAKNVACTSCHKGIVHAMPKVGSTAPHGLEAGPPHGFAQID
jgi:predicted CXXCH cytochrome family protein